MKSNTEADKKFTKKKKKKKKDPPSFLSELGPDHENNHEYEHRDDSNGDHPICSHPS